MANNDSDNSIRQTRSRAKTQTDGSLEKPTLLAKRRTRANKTSVVASKINQSRMKTNTTLNNCRKKNMVHDNKSDDLQVTREELEEEWNRMRDEREIIERLKNEMVENQRVLEHRRLEMEREYQQRLRELRRGQLREGSEVRPSTSQDQVDIQAQSMMNASSSSQNHVNNHQQNMISSANVLTNPQQYHGLPLLNATGLRNIAQSGNVAHGNVQEFMSRQQQSARYGSQIADYANNFQSNRATFHQHCQGFGDNVSLNYHLPSSYTLEGAINYPQQQFRSEFDENQIYQPRGNTRESQCYTHLNLGPSVNNYQRPLVTNIDANNLANVRTQYLPQNDNQGDINIEATPISMKRGVNVNNTLRSPYWNNNAADYVDNVQFNQPTTNTRDFHRQYQPNQQLHQQDHQLPRQGHRVPPGSRTLYGQSQSGEGLVGGLIPVYGGTVKPLTASTFTADNYFGEDGLGDFVFDREIIAKVDKSKHAAIALVELAKKHKGELNLLLLGPLTNVAVAIALDPDFLNNVKKIYIMGGCYLGKGNRSPGVEYNFSHDPESNFVVFNSTKEIVLLPWEAALHAKISIDWRKDVLGTIQSDYMDFLNKAEKKVLNGPTWTSADTMMAAAMIWPNLATKKLSTNVTPITDGAARGGVLVDFGEPPEKSINTEIIEELDVEEFKKLLVYYLSN